MIKKLTDYYFEDWYFKLAAKDVEDRIDFFIGKRKTGEQVQYFVTISGSMLKQDISYKEPIVVMDEKEITIGESKFTTTKIVCDIEREGNVIKGEVEVTEPITLPTSFIKRGLMGPFDRFPLLKSHHDIPCLQGILKGSLVINGKSICFNDGKIYIEKSYGKSFPKVWIRSQCNHFKSANMAVMIGIARLPLVFEYYTAFAIPVFYKGKLEVFSNYNGGHIAKLYRYKDYIHLIVLQKNKMLEIRIYGDQESNRTSMHHSYDIRDVYLCKNAKIEVRLQQSNHIIFDEVGRYAELEIGGNTSKLK